MQASDKTAKAVASKEKKAEPQQKAKPSSSPEEIAPPIKVAQ
jgi:hypothetical protein